MLDKYGEKREIIHAMECHHGDYDPTTVEAVLVNAADALSAARPGARREILENYVHRLERLESIANSMEGVSKSFAIQAGRELRIIVNAEKIGDEQAIWLSKDVARKIESELQYPGQIKVTVIREMRTVEYAKSLRCSGLRRSRAQVGRRRPAPACRHLAHDQSPLHR